MLSVILGLPNTPVSISYRFFVLLLGIFIIVFSFPKRGMKMTSRGWLLLTFWLIYGSLLINDISFKGIRFRGESPFYLYSFIFGSSCLSFTTMLIGGKYLNLTRKFSWTIVFFLTIIMLLMSQKVQFYSNSISGNTGLFQGRAIISTEESNGIINPILIGSYGAFLLLMSLSIFTIRNGSMKFWKQIFLIFSSIIGMAGVLFSGSRGPLLVVMIGFSFIFWRYVTFYKANTVHVLKVLGLTISLMLGSILALIPIINKGNVTSLVRFGRIFSPNENGVKERRYYEWEAAIQQYINHPILGDKYVNAYDGFYPHNVYLEVLMATGTIGGLFFFIGFYLCIKKLKRLWKYNSAQAFPIIILSVAVFIMRITTGALFNSVEFWAILGLLCSTSRTPFNKPKVII